MCHTNERYPYQCYKVGIKVDLQIVATKYQISKPHSFSKANHIPPRRKSSMWYKELGIPIWLLYQKPTKNLTLVFTNVI